MDDWRCMSSWLVSLSAYRLWLWNTKVTDIKFPLATVCGLIGCVNAVTSSHVAWSLTHAVYYCRWIIINTTYLRYCMLCSSFLIRIWQELASQIMVLKSRTSFPEVYTGRLYSLTLLCGVSSGTFPTFFVTMQVMDVTANQGGVLHPRLWYLRVLPLQRIIVHIILWVYMSCWNVLQGLKCVWLDCGRH